MRVGKRGARVGDDLRRPLPGFSGVEPRSAFPRPRDEDTPITVAGRELFSTPVFDTYWRFASARQAIYLARLAGEPPPWTNDRTLQDHRFTNAFRASDRVSQHLLRHVIYGPDVPADPQDVVFRVLLFKMFNKIETWERLAAELGPITWNRFDFGSYRRVLDAAALEGPIYTAAYMMPPPRLGEDRKHANHLRLIERMMNSGFPDAISSARSLEDVYGALVQFPSIGRFLGYQLAVDLNYSAILNFGENDFVVAGPGARDGIRKCFGSAAMGIEQEVIQYVTDHQEIYFGRLGIAFDGLFGRPLHLIDCQNLFCEVDKYARVMHPHINGVSGRRRIKQKFRPRSKPETPMFPPRWGLQERVRCFVQSADPL